MRDIIAWAARREGPTARFIPAWAIGPGVGLGKKPRAEGPSHESGFQPSSMWASKNLGRWPRLEISPLLWRFVSFAVFPLVVAIAPARAAKGDKTPNPDKRLEKIERKLERQSAAEMAAAMAQRQTMAAPAPVPMSDRSSRSYGSSRSRSSEYREPTTPADAKYDNFRIIVEKNIFNPTRIGRTRERSEEKSVRIDTIALVGTMQSDKGVVAFFDSPDSAYRKTLREGQSVGEFKVEKIKPDQVDLSRGGKPLSLRVAQQLRRAEGGDWSVTTAEPPRTDSAGPSSAGSGRAPEPAAPPAIPPDASDALRRLMEARQKQLKQ